MRHVSVSSILLRTAAFVTVAAATLTGQTPTRNIWQEQYRSRTAEEMAKQFEEPSRAVFRYRTAIAGLMALKPGMTVAEVGAGSGFLARTIAQHVGPTGRVIATDLDDKMVDYMNARAKAEGLANFKAIKGSPDTSGLEPDSVDAVAVVSAYSFFDQPRSMLQSIALAVRQGGLVVIVDVPETGSGSERAGVEAEAVIATASSVGLELVNESSVVPGHYAIRLRKK
jgi:ubiquinone/menaquinone biosynthesis C-methylase UbiE